MWKRKLTLSAGKGLGGDMAQQLPLIKEAGFDGIFALWSDAQTMDQWVQMAKACGLDIPLMHAPFRKSKAMWIGSGEEAEEGVRQLTDCIHSCAAHEVPVIVTHAYIGIDNEAPIPTQEGLERYYRVLRAAEGTGVTVAFENTEGEEYLEALFANFSDHPNIGFCWDSGHEICYNHSQDMLGKYGRHLCATHLNDNVGIMDYSGKLCTKDDLHLIPFDGITDWQELTARLAATGFDRPLTFELKRCARPDRHESDRYMRISLEEYLADCYKGACRVAALFERAQKMQKNE